MTRVAVVRRASARCGPRRYVGSAVGGLLDEPLDQVLALDAGKPATSRMSFSGYIAVIWPPSSGQRVDDGDRSPRKPA